MGSDLVGGGKKRVYVESVEQIAEKLLQGAQGAGVEAVGVDCDPWDDSAKGVEFPIEEGEGFGVDQVACYEYLDGKSV